MSSKYHLRFTGVSAFQFYILLFLLSVTVSESHATAVITSVSPPKSENKFPTSVTLSSVKQATASNDVNRQTQSVDNQTESVSRQTQSIDSSSTEVINTVSSYTVSSLPTRVTKVITIAPSSRRPLTTHDAHTSKPTTSVSEATNITTPNPATTNQSHFTRENSNVTVPSISITTTNDTGSENGSTPLTHQVTTKLTPTAFHTSTAFVFPTTTAPKSSTRPRFARPLTVIQHLDINGKFNPRLNNKEDVLRQNYTKVVQTFLMKHYRTFLKSLQNVTVISFSEGSINVEYRLVIDPPVGNSSALGVVEGLREAVQSWTDTQPVALIGTISINKTLEQSLPLLKKLQTKLQKPCMGVYDACSVSEVCQFDSKGDYYCKHKCLDLDCGQHGVCAVNMAGKAICSCTNDAEFIYHGPKCRQKRSKHTTEPETGSNTVAIAVGVCVPVIVILGIIIIVMFLRRRKNNDKVDTISTSNLDIENYKIENIPVDGFEHQNQQMRYQPSNIGKPIHRISSGSNQSHLSGGEFTMDQMPSFDNMDPPQQRTISDYMDKN